MFKHIFSRADSNKKHITLSELIDVLQNVCQLSFVTRSENTSSFDFDRAKSYLKERYLDYHITFISHKFNTLPLNSERHLYGMNNIEICNLHINLDDNLAWVAHDDWEPLSYAKWHFQKCYFDADSPNMHTIQFPWRGDFRFYKNQFAFRTGRIGGHWLLVFRLGSRILFQGNNFQGHNIQTSCAPSRLARPESDKANQEVRESGSIFFVGNKAISSLDILGGFTSISFTGMNRIEQLVFKDILDTSAVNVAGNTQKPRIYFGPREKIDSHFHYCLQHRNLFLYLRNLSAASSDIRQLNVLDKQIDRIEYFLNKNQDAPNPMLDYKQWVEYWQDRLLYAWRRWSSDFYRSWVRPLSMIIFGYALLNAVPILVIDNFSLSDWLELTLRPVSEIANYESALSRIVGDDYDKISLANKNMFRFIGLIKVVWIAMWSFAFARSIKR